MFEPMNFIYNLRYMGLGMLGIAAVMLVIIIITTALNLLPKASEEGKNSK